MTDRTVPRATPAEAFKRARRMWLKGERIHLAPLSEELGIGRPSTYASILSTLIDRDYVVLDNKRFKPQDKGHIVTIFLEQFFTQYVEYDFTASLEEKLDLISDGKLGWKQLLDEFWNAFKAICKQRNMSVNDLLTEIDRGRGGNLSSAVRVYVLDQLRQETRHRTHAADERLS